MDTASGYGRKFEHRAPAHQNAIDIFEGKWASDLTPICPLVRSGDGPFFTADMRPRMLADRLGSAGRLDNLSVLELGPLEGAHTYQLEQLGAKRVLSIEANVEAFLKCLIVKEIAKLQVTTFMLGDFVPYLMETKDRFDIVMCSGVLYHMADPIKLISGIGRVTEKCFIWSHYYEETHPLSPAFQPVSNPRYPGLTQYTLAYGDMAHGRFWGGNDPVSVWLKRDDMLTAFKGAGFSSIGIIDDSPNNLHGACITFTASRPS